VIARNEYGESLPSSVLTLYCAFKPEPPNSVQSENQATNVVLSWSLPVNNGAEVSSYLVLIRAKSSEFVQESVNCSPTAVVASRQCTVSLDLLKAAPYSLVVLDTVEL
jgi:hypothetical protein